MAIVPLQPLGSSEYGLSLASPLVSTKIPSNQAQDGETTASEADPAGDLKSITEVRQFAAAVRQQAQVAGTQAPNAPQASPPPAEVTQVINQNADKVFQLVMQFSGGDPKLLSQAQGIVSQAFAQVNGKGMSPMQAFLAQERVMQLIQARLQQAHSGQDINLSA